MHRSYPLYDHLKFLIERYDHYYDSVNNKGAFLIGLNTFILGGLCAGYSTLYKNITWNTAIWLLTIALFTICIYATIKTILAIGPFTKDNSNNDDQKSLVFFGGVAKHTLSDFMNRMLNGTDVSVISEMIRQVHVLAYGLNAKYQKLKVVGYCLIVQFILLTILLIYLTKNLK